MTTTTATGIPALVRARLKEQADPARAPGQQAYMKSEMPFRGVTVGEVRRIVADCARGVGTGDELRAAALELWDGAAFREERYAGMMLLAGRPAVGDPAGVPVLLHMARTGRWWDFVDDLAHRVAELLDTHPVATAGLVRRWSTDPDLWVRRLAILGQLGRKGRTDTGLLVDVIEPNLADREFFIRKAIGWALRDYARTDPDWVLEFASSHELSPLSRREALKHLS